MSGSAGPFGFVVGMRREARIVEDIFGDAARCLCSGADSERAAARARELLAAGCPLLVSVGYAGGLDPALTVGDIVTADHVLAPDGTVFQARVPELRGGARFRIGPVLGSAHAIERPEAKATAFSRTGALAVDMESHAVAAVAVSRSAPFCVLRAVLDDARTAAPAWTAKTVTPDGGTDWRRLTGGILSNPGDLPALMALGKAERRAAAALREALAVLRGVLAHETRVP